MRVLSPRIEPPVRVDDGSTARTATRKPSEVSSVPNASMKVDLPTPGTPLMPIRRARPLCGRSSVSNSCAMSRCWGFVDSTRVMARATRARLPSRTPFT